MFTRCPNDSCNTTYQVTAETLRSAMGMVRCVKCNQVFNALATIVDERPEGTIVPLRSQLPFKSFGDRTVIDPGLVRNMPAFQQLATSSGRFREPLTSDKPDDAEQATSEARAEPAEEAAGDYARERQQRLASTAAELGLDRIDKFERDEDVPTDEAAELAPTQTSWRTFVPSWSDLLLALRNLTRHRRRTAMGLLAISVGVIAMLVAGGFIEWSKWFLRETTIMAHLGHIQLVARDFFESGEADPFSFVLSEDAQLLDEISSIPAVDTVTPRLGFSGLISFGDISIAIMGEGVDPEREARVSKQLTIVSGDGLSVEHDDGIIIGKGLAESLDVGVGDTVVLLATPEGGGLGAAEARVLGTFQTSNKAYDDVSIRLPINMARQLLKVQGAHKWVILLDDTNLTGTVLAQLQERFAAREDVEFVPWSDLADFYNKSAQLFAAQMNVIRLVIAIIIVVSISNTLIMNVVERTAEIGTLMALGLKRAKILALFVSEGFMLGCLGGFVGALLGVALGMGISAVGIPLPPAPGMDFPVRGEIMVTWQLALGGFLLGMIATLVASIYPARKASRLEIVDALRHSR